MPDRARPARLRPQHARRPSTPPTSLPARLCSDGTRGAAGLGVCGFAGGAPAEKLKQHIIIYIMPGRGRATIFALQAACTMGAHINMMDHSPSAPPPPPSPPDSPPNQQEIERVTAMWILIGVAGTLMLVPVLYVVFNCDFLKKKYVKTIDTELRREAITERAASSRRATPHI